MRTTPIPGEKIYPSLPDIRLACQMIINGICRYRRSTPLLTEKEEFDFYLLAKKWADNFDIEEENVFNGIMKELSDCNKVGSEF
jgi:hypothetical protein